MKERVHDNINKSRHVLKSSRNTNKAVQWDIEFVWLGKSCVVGMIWGLMFY